ncbi:hypothetical protein [Paludisphaera soli]|uniref:hypothetical protein n=1 Tax=Paludisphaera soli TaxID=2712865 RepID=UPI0013EB13A9|nr:hypothetical protein [Paludisphaera soli]
MGCLSRSDFFKAVEPRRERVEVPALGGYVNVRQVTAGEVDELESRMSRLSRRERRRQSRARTVAMVAVDDAGSPLFGEDDVESLADRPVAELEPILRAHIKLNTVSTEEADELGKG